MPVLTGLSVVGHVIEIEPTGPPCWTPRMSPRGPSPRNVPPQTSRNRRTADHRTWSWPSRRTGPSGHDPVSDRRLTDSRRGAQRPLSGGCVGESLRLAEADVDGEVCEDIGHLAAISKLHGRAGGRA